jgi:hypothetical protein
MPVRAPLNAIDCPWFPRVAQIAPRTSLRSRNRLKSMKATRAQALKTGKPSRAAVVIRTIICGCYARADLSLLRIFRK